MRRQEIDALKREIDEHLQGMQQRAADGFLDWMRKQPTAVISFCSIAGKALEDPTYHGPEMLYRFTGDPPRCVPNPEEAERVRAIVERVREQEAAGTLWQSPNSFLPTVPLKYEDMRRLLWLLERDDELQQLVHRGAECAASIPAPAPPEEGEQAWEEG
jgi:hypothetical protein